MYRRIILPVLVISVLFIVTFGCSVSQEQTPTETIKGEIPSQSQETYNKLAPELAKFLHTISSDELVKVNIWFKCDLQSIDEAIAEKYPEANLIGGRPSENTDLELWEKIEAERLETIKQVISETARPLTELIESKGFEEYGVSFFSPIIFTEISKALILEIQGRPDVSTIYKYNAEYVIPSETSIAPTRYLPTGTDIEFETIVKAENPPTGLGAPNKPEIIVITSKPETTIPGISPHDIRPDFGSEIVIKEVDYSTYLVLIVFMGSRDPYSSIEVIRIMQNEDTINLLAQYPEPQKTVVPGINFPYHIVKINKDSITQFGLITFKLFDQWGNEQAITTCEVLP